jgi:thiol:disulfide interchange protein DsbD
MASIDISTGYVPKPAVDGIWRRRVGGALAGALLLCALSAHALEPKLLPNERAFAFSARGVDERTVEARFVISDGYYLYRDRLKFAIDPGALGATALPPGKVKEDQFFGKVETYRNQLVVKLPLEAAAPGTAVTITAESQGCADLGVCYPPQAQKVTLTLPAAGGRPGAPVEATPAKKPWLK